VRGGGGADTNKPHATKNIGNTPKWMQEGKLQRRQVKTKEGVGVSPLSLSELNRPDKLEEKQEGAGKKEEEIKVKGSQEATKKRGEVESAGGSIVL